MAERIYSFIAKTDIEAGKLVVVDKGTGKLMPFPEDSGRPYAVALDAIAKGELFYFDPNTGKVWRAHQ